MSLITRTFASESRPGVTYTTHVDRDSGAGVCDCPGFATWGRCSHVRRILERVCLTPCPVCGGDVELVTDGQVAELLITPECRQPIVRTKRAPFGACTSCEFCIEVGHVPQ